MKKDCSMCKEYWRARSNKWYDHPCYLRENPEETCEGFQLDYTRDVCMKKYPHLIAHMICESLGYFSPQAAANALAFYKAGKPFCCEWYSHMAQFQPEKDMFNDAAVLRIGKEVLRWAFQKRHYHKGYMAEIKQADALVKAENTKPGCTGQMLASWF